MKRILRIMLVIVLLLGVALLILLVAQRPSPPVSGPIVLPDGSWVRIEAVTYGTNHLVGPPLAHLADRMPQAVRNFMLRYLGRPAVMRFSTTTSSPKLVLWLNRGISAAPFPTNTGYLECVLSDTNGVTSGDVVSYAARYPLETKEFAVFPRREPEIVLSIYYHDSTGAVFKRGSVAFANPVYRSYSEWKPEPLPATRRVGDVEVTLEKLSTGHDQDYNKERLKAGRHEITFGTNRLDGGNDTVCFLRLRPLANSNEVWRVAHVITSDATGNKIGNNMLGGDGAEGYFTYSPALWPGETWKLNCELKRTAGFKPEEQFTFRDVPLGDLSTMNRIGWTTNFNSITVTLERIFWRAPATHQMNGSSSERSEVHFITSGLTNDLHLELLSARANNGTNLIVGPWTRTGDYRAYYFRELPTNSTADFTFAVQRSRWVEFLAKPETGTARREVAPKNKQ